MTVFLEIPFPNKLLLALSTAGLLSLLSTPVVKEFAWKIGAIDIPRDSRRMHDHPIPRLGGLAIALSFLLTVLLFTEMDRQMEGMILGSLMILALGVVDDCVTLKAAPKLIVQNLAAMLVVMHGCTIQFLTDPFSSVPGTYFDLGIMAGPVTVVWIVLMTNAVNFIDGLDGLAVGVSSISASFMLVIALLVSEKHVAVVLACLLGSCLGFLPYNLHPAKIFMGDSGSTFLGFILAVLSIQGLFKMYAVISFTVPFLILGIPFLDIAFAVIRRLWKHRNPMTADREHIHHRLIDMGFSQKQTVAITYGVTGVLGMSAVLLAESGEMKTMILILAAMIAALAGIVVIFRPHHRQHTEK